MADGKENEVEPKKDEKMKTQRMILIALCGVAMLIGTSSCKKEKQENENEGEMMRIEVSVGGTDGNTKTHLVHGEHSYKVAWDTWDAFKLFPTNGTNGSIFHFSEMTGSDGTTAVFEGFRPGEAPYYGCYPSGKVSCERAGVFKFTIDETQEGNPETVDGQTATANAGPMVGYMKDAESGLVFQNTMSWLKVGLTGNAIIKRVVLTDLGDEQNPYNNKLNGTLTVTCSGEGGNFTFTSEMDPDAGTNKLAIVSNEGVELNDGFTYFWFQVPAGSLKNLELDAYLDVDGLTKVLELTKTIPSGVSENTVLTAEVSSQTIDILEPEIALYAGCNNEEHIAQFYATVTGKDELAINYEVGICYNYKTDSDPTIGNCRGKQKIGDFTIVKDEVKEIEYDLVGLEVGVEYKICIYTINSSVSYSGVKTVTGGNIPVSMSWSNGLSPKTFTVGMDDGTPRKVKFSQGNLMYLAKGGSGGDALASVTDGENVRGTWRFASHQFDCIGGIAQKPYVNDKENHTTWIDFFGWSASGYNHNNINYQPWCTLTSDNGYYSYSDWKNNLYDKSDWGYNAITNGGNVENYGWRTLSGGTNGEWRYLLELRDGASSKWGLGTVGGCTQGLIILPDGVWSGPSFVSGKTQGWLTNEYTYSEWAAMDAAGAIFLPASGNRSGTTFSNVGIYGYYWSSTRYSSTNSANVLHFGNNLFNPQSSSNRNYGYSVRLVKDATNTE